MTIPNRPAPPLPMGSQNTVFIKEVRFDTSYLRTTAGILKVTVILLNLLGFVCIISSAFWSNGRGVYFNIVAHLGLWYSLGMLTLYLYHFVEKYHNIKWLKIEMITCIVLTFLNLIASTIVVAFGNPGYSAAGLLNLLGFVCIISSAFWSNGRGVYFNIVAHLGLWYSLGMLTLYLCHFVEKYHNIKWLKIEMITCIVLTFLNLIASTIVVAFGNPGYSAAGFFGYLAMVCYGFDAFFKAKALQAGKLAQGQRVFDKQPNGTTPAV